MIAPDHLGFGLSDAPTDVDYTFDALTALTEGLLEQLGVTKYAIYVQDYGAPIGWRLALRRPDAITAIITQNGNATRPASCPRSGSRSARSTGSGTRTPRRVCAPR